MRRASAAGYPSPVPSLFRRKSTELATEPAKESAATSSAAPESPAVPRKGYTPSKRELGKVTPKRPPANPRLAKRPALTKEELRAQRRAERAALAEEFRRVGGPRDRGPERALVRDIVDSRRTIGTWFLGGALVVLIGSAQVMPPVVQLASNLLWLALAFAVVIDSILIARRVRTLVRARFPKTEERMRSLYFYAIMRALTFRRMRIPVPRVEIGQKI